jgi:hypothetical protein
VAKKHRRKVGECTYCGNVGVVTDDHVPPKNLFPQPRPSTLIKVPACLTCHAENRKVSQDDEYFRLMVALRDDVGDRPDVQELLPVVMRSLERPDKSGFTRAFLNGVREVAITTKSGLYLGTGLTYHADLGRLNNVVRRTVMGLFYHESKRRLPSGYVVESWSLDHINSLTTEQREQLLETVRTIWQKPLTVIGDYTFAYALSRTIEDENITGWILTFYGKVHFLAVTIPESVWLIKQAMLKQGIK